MGLPKKAHHLLFLSVLGILAFIRFFRLSGMGIFDDDAVVYNTLTHNWLDGNINIGANKLGYHLLCFLAAKAIGMYDDTTLFLNSAMDLVGIGLLYLLALRLRINAFLALSAVVVYGCLPIVLYENTRGLPHLPSMAFVVGSVLICVRALAASGWRRSLWMFLCGACAAFAGLTHPTALALLPVLPVLVLLERPGRLFSWKDAGRAVADAGSYLTGAALTVLSVVGVLTVKSHDYLRSLGEFVRGLKSHHDVSTNGSGPDIMAKVTAFGTVIPELLSPVFLGFMVLVILTAIVLRLRQGRDAAASSTSSVAHILWTVVIGYVLINAVINKTVLDRLLIPAAPLAVLGTYALIDRTGLCRRWRWFGPAMLAIAVAISAFHVASHPQYFWKPKTVYRRMGDQLAHRLGPDARALVLPSRFRLVMMETMYLDARWVYRLKEPWVPDPALLKAFRIKYILIPKDLNNLRATGEDRRKAAIEVNVMSEWLKTQKGRTLYTDADLAIIELEDPPTGGNSPLLVPATFPFYNSLQAAYIGPRFYRLTRTRKQG